MTSYLVCVRKRESSWKTGDVMPPVKSEGKGLFSKLCNTCRFTSSISKIVEFRSSYTTFFKYFDALKALGVEWEDTLNTDVVRAHFTDGKRFTSPFTSKGDAHTFKSLNTCFITFFNAYTQSKGITCFKFRYFFSCHLCLLECSYISIFHLLPFHSAFYTYQV